MGKFTKKYEAQRIFEVQLLNGQKLTLKNYPNKFQKRLLAAQISEDQSLIYKEIINVLNEQIISPVDFDLNSVQYFEIHKLFLHLISNSYQNKISITLSCDKEHERINEETKKSEIYKCEGHVVTVIDLEKVEVANLQDLIYNCNDFNLKFKYPNFVEYIEFMEKLQIDDPTEKFLAIAELVNKCVYEVEDDEGKVLFSELDEEDQTFIVESISPQILSKAATDLIKPYIVVAIPFICPECGHKKKIELKGLENFFRQSSIAPSI